MFLFVTRSKFSGNQRLWICAASFRPTPQFSRKRKTSMNSVSALPADLNAHAELASFTLA